MNRRVAATFAAAVTVFVAACDEEVDPRKEPAPLENVSIVGPTAIDVTDDGTIYIAGAATAGDPPSPLGVERPEDKLADAVIAILDETGRVDEVLAGGGDVELPHAGHSGPEPVDRMPGDDVRFVHGIETISVREDVVYFGRLLHEESLWRIDADRRVTQVAGVGAEDPAVGVAAREIFLAPWDIASAEDGDVYVAGIGGPVLAIGADGTITRAIGDRYAEGFAGDGGDAARAKFSLPRGVAVSSDGNVYIGDSRNHRIRRVTPEDIISTVAGGGTQRWRAGARATDVKLGETDDVEISDAGDVYFVDDNELVYRLRNGRLTRIAGGGSKRPDEGVEPTAARFRSIDDIDIGPDGTLYLLDRSLKQVFTMREGESLGALLDRR